jgi:MoxR-like ATPase
MSAFDEAFTLQQKMLKELSKAVIGKDDIKEALLLALIADGHVLIEGPAGSAKTQLARSFAQAIGGSFKRLQFTPDMMPADVTGFFINQQDGQSRLIRGPIFAHFVLADELNRTTPRTQSALLEAMQEHQVTIDRDSYALEAPFMVIATQVFAGAEGTYPLTDVQIDRFLLRISSQYVSPDVEKLILSNIDSIDKPDIQKVVTLDEIISLQHLVKEVHIKPEIIDYIVNIISELRSDPDVLSPPSTRGSIALYKCSRALAMLGGRDFVLPDDIKHLAPLALEHRIRVRPEAEMEDVTPLSVLTRTLERVPVPKPSL